MTDDSSAAVKPWYRHTWAWFVLSPLILIMFVCGILVTVAYKQADDVVIDNYYKEGRMINLRIEEDKTAKALGIGADLHFDLETGEVLLTLAAQQSSGLPEAVVLYMDHPVEADYDLQIVLHSIVPGRYRADLESRIANRWYIRLMPKAPEGSAEELWRLVGEINLAKQTSLTMGDYE